MKLPDDPIILELMPEFIDTWIQDINTQMPSILESRNKDDLYRLGHTIKGSCLQFGFDDLAKYGYRIMDYSKEENWDKAAEMEPILKQIFSDLKVEVEAQLKQMSK
ncbi:Hpt domain-containing protein [Bacteroidota bacterium]